MNEIMVSMVCLFPRHGSRIPRTLSYWKGRKTYPPIKVALIKKTGKYLILDGHHRYYTLLGKGITQVKVIVERVINRVKLDKYGRFQEVMYG